MAVAVIGLLLVALMLGKDGYAFFTVSFIKQAMLAGLRTV